MKKTLSFLFAIIMVISSFAFPVSSFAGTAKIHVEDALLSLEKSSGYVSGQTSIVTGNCYGFVSAVCQNLYGVSYAYEQFVGSYQFAHTTGNYYTVATSTFSKPSTSDNWTATATAIKEFVINNAAVGDVIQYGCANNSTTHKHTAIIQHIDSEKMQIFHSNYASGNYSSATCHTDTIYWSSFLSSPNANTKDASGNITSLNKFFGAPLNCNNGLGLSINRYKNLEASYYLDMAVMPAPIIKTERKSSTSISFSWNEISGATLYGYFVTDSTGTKVLNDSFTTNLTALVGGFTPGQIYNFYVYAIKNDENGQTGVKTIQSLPPAPSKPVTVSSNSNGNTISWAKKSDISGCVIYRSAAGGVYTQLAVLDSKTVCSYTDTAIANNTSYKYKVQRYINYNGLTYYSGKSSASDALCVSVASPINVKATNKTSNSIKLSWSAVPNATSYIVAYKLKGTSNWKTTATTSQSKIISGLKTNKTYSIMVCAANNFGIGAYSSVVNKKQLPPTPSSVKAKKKGKDVVISWAKSSGFDGYYLVRSTSKSFNKNVRTKKIKSNKKLSYTDKSVKKGKTYYYKICRYKGKIRGSYSSKVKVKM